ncbi:RhtB (resistance to homoserine/threonine) family protein [Inquilinus ginsengisoli]|uniref:RhtB (Resistance to homoserine/threonine) family protein n=1 Tax=Inquilinus ginsengisoli TaxID=363840 RepID=A0ABU1JL07_9PROT|nr:LysE family transporter [Inquilinus ginsengisoli]MDR6289280.1 RhtB (resistance to homoserine/threonine) family protein [Inquilinus ginsengisoli]
MDLTVPLLSILGAIAVGAASPGPSFVFVTRTAIALSRRDGLAAALGMGVGGVVYGGLGLFGLQALLSQVEWLFMTLKVLGGLYLLWLALGLWRTAAKPITVPKTADGRPRSVRRSFTMAAVTQLSNPKAAIVYGSIFAAFLPAHVPAWTFAVLLPAIFAIEAGWYAIVALAFSSDRPRAAYLRWKRWFDRVAGTVMGALGLRLILGAGKL